MKIVRQVSEQVPLAAGRFPAWSCCLVSPYLLFKSRAPPTSTPLSLHDALPIYVPPDVPVRIDVHPMTHGQVPMPLPLGRDRKSTRLNSSHVAISYAVFCLKKNSQVPRVHRPNNLATDPHLTRNQVRIRDAEDPV